MSKILVIGSTNIDMITRTKEFPAPGETVEGHSFMQAMGGKGANQAMAAHRQGGDVEFITCLGDDQNSRGVLEYFRNEGLKVTSSFTVEGAQVGTASILVNDHGENNIVIVSGANAMLSEQYVDSIEAKISEADIVLVQMEIPYNSVKKICLLASKHGTKVILNVAPAIKLDDELIGYLDMIILNESEIEKVTNQSISDGNEERAMDQLLKKGVKEVILTLGSLGCLFKTGQTLLHIPAFSVKALDSTAAGDTFCGALAVKLGQNTSIKEAIEYASASSAVCVTRHGAQPSIPTEEEVLDFMASREILEKNFK